MNEFNNSLLKKIRDLEADNKRLRDVVESYQMVEDMNNNLISALIDHNRMLFDAANNEECVDNEEYTEITQPRTVKIKIKRSAESND